MAYLVGGDSVVPCSVPELLTPGIVIDRRSGSPGKVYLFWLVELAEDKFVRLLVDSGLDESPSLPSMLADDPRVNGISVMVPLPLGPWPVVLIAVEEPRVIESVCFPGDHLVSTSAIRLATVNTAFARRIASSCSAIS